MPASDCTVLFGALPTEIKIPPGEKRLLRSFARQLSSGIAKGRSFSCVLADDAELARLNKIFLGHDYPTDVLSFPCTDTLGQLGDIAISVQRAQVQALEFGHGIFDEIRILMLHGLLHLTGMDHERDSGEMASAELRWRSELGLAPTLIGRRLVART